MPGSILTRSVALPSPQETPDKKASQRTSSRNPYTAAIAWGRVHTLNPHSGTQD